MAPAGAAVRSLDQARATGEGRRRVDTSQSAMGQTARTNLPGADPCDARDRPHVVPCQRRCDAPESERVNVLMRRFAAAPWLAAIFAVLAGISTFAWKAHDLGRSCGYSEGGRLPYFPTKLAFPVLVAVPVALTIIRALSERRAALDVLRLAALAAILAAAAFGAADLAFFLSRECYA